MAPLAGCRCDERRDIRNRDGRRVSSKRGAAFAAELFARLVESAAARTVCDKGFAAIRAEFAAFPIIAATFGTAHILSIGGQAFLEVAQALACDALNKQPFVVIRVIREALLTGFCLTYSSFSSSSAVCRMIWSKLSSLQTAPSFLSSWFI
jgi:hypothetical protein